MFDLIYVEEAVEDHPRTREVLERMPRSTVVRCERYGEVFNPRAQSFRLQKRRPALILAEKHGNLVLDAPEGYGIGGERNFYFSHLLNCPYDCRYCFLQGMYQSAHLVLFVNYEDFQDALERRIAEESPQAACFFAGYDCDSLALEPLTGFAGAFLPFFARFPGVSFELRTKSAQIARLLERPALPNCVIAFSFTPQEVSDELERGVPSVERRLEAMSQLEDAGWPLGLRFDPLIHRADFEDCYRRLFAQVFERLRPEGIHSVTVGPFRMPREMHETVRRLYPEEPLFAEAVEERNGLATYPAGIDRRLEEFCRSELAGRFPLERVFSNRA